LNTNAPGGLSVANLLRYLSFKGRANRQRYWVTTLLIAVFFIIGMMLTLGMGSIIPPLGWFFGLVLIVFYAAILANCARRLHDRNKSAWWLLLFSVLPTILGLPSRLAGYSGDEGFQAAASALAVLGLPFTIWGFVEMGCLMGTTGPNKYGEDPLQASVSPADETAPGVVG
jgi:uncharacterized membrane protein YhaH (DUF805 family)